jgi:hypothetical protein
MVVFETYGNLIRKSYNEQTAGVNKLVRDLLSSKYLEYTEEIGLLEWINELKARNDNFEAIYSDRNKDTAEQDDTVVKAARLDTDDVMRLFVAGLRRWRLPAAKRKNISLLLNA